jgi:hypothetical protein
MNEFVTKDTRPDADVSRMESLLGAGDDVVKVAPLQVKDVFWTLVDQQS